MGPFFGYSSVNVTWLSVSAEVKATQSEEAKNVCAMRDAFLRGCCSLVHVFTKFVYLLFHSWMSVEAIYLFGLKVSHMTQRLQSVLDHFTNDTNDKCEKKWTLLSCGASSNVYNFCKIELLILPASLSCDPVTDNREGQITNSRCPCGSVLLSIH